MNRRLAALFLLALLTVLAALGVLAATFGPWALGGYLVGAALLLMLMVRQARATRRQEQHDRQAAGKTCSCCTSTVFDPIEVI
ncbi:MAG: hypothetical protein ABIO67_02050 [Mycobacteriales bacterium]